MNGGTAEKIVCPSIVFKVKDCYYSINSEHVAGIIQIPEYQDVPEAPGHIRGIFVLRGSTVTMVDMRAVLGHSTLRQEFEQFESIVASAGEEHTMWAEELERCAMSGDIFTLPEEPDQCSYGGWYHSAGESDGRAVAYLRGAEEPHRLLHEAAAQMRQLTALGDYTGVETLITRLKGGYLPALLRQFDEAVESFRGELAHEMVLVFAGEGEQTSIVVDEVVSVEYLERISDGSPISRFQHGGLVTGVCKSSRVEEIVLEISEQQLLALCK